MADRPVPLQQTPIRVPRSSSPTCPPVIVNGDIVLAEQVHHLGRPGHVAPIMNLAVYEMRDGLITAWRDYTNPEYARTLF